MELSDFGYQYSQVINLSTNEIIYKTTGGTLALQDDGLVERDNGNTVFLKIENNQLVKVPQLEAAQATVSGAGEYVVDVCTDDNKYSIKSIDTELLAIVILRITMNYLPTYI